MKKALAFLFIALFMLGAITVTGCEVDNDIPVDDIEDTEY